MTGERTRPTVLLTVKESAARLGVTGYVAERWIRNGDLPATDLNSGRRRLRIIRVRQSDLDRFIARGVFPRRSPHTARSYARRTPAPMQHIWTDEPTREGTMDRASTPLLTLKEVADRLTASAESPSVAPPASTESLRSLERAGAYRYQMLLTDANGDKITAMKGAAKKGLAMVASPADDQPGFSSKVKVVEQKNGKLELQIDFSERTSVTAISDGQNAWMSSGFHFVDHNYELGKSRVVTLADWKTSRSGPLRMEITVRPFVVDAD